MTYGPEILYIWHKPVTPELGVYHIQRYIIFDLQSFAEYALTKIVNFCLDMYVLHECSADATSASGLDRTVYAHGYKKFLEINLPML